MGTIGIIYLAVFIFLIFYILAHAIGGLSDSEEDTQGTPSNVDKQKEWITANNLSQLPKYSYHKNYFIMDENSQTVYVSNSVFASLPDPFQQIPFSEIIGFDTLLDNQVETHTEGGLSRAVVGGLLFGGSVLLSVHLRQRQSVQII